VVLFTDIEFSWDARKARANALKHGVSFSSCTAIFRDPLALTIYDPEHSAGEDRWVTIGKGQSDQYLVVVHTCDQTQSSVTRMRIISARVADKREIRAYESTRWQVREDQHMKDHYDFSKGARGKFYKPDAKFHLPVYLDQEVELQLAAKAEAKGVELSELVNELLKKELASGTG
jgi:uncharacterized DUF497 family protein